MHMGPLWCGSKLQFSPSPPDVSFKCFPPSSLRKKKSWLLSSVFLNCLQVASPFAHAKSSMTTRQVRQINVFLKCRYRAQKHPLFYPLHFPPPPNSCLWMGSQRNPRPNTAQFRNYFPTQKYVFPPSRLLFYSLCLTFIHLFIHSVNIYGVLVMNTQHLIMYARL